MKLIKKRAKLGESVMMHVRVSTTLKSQLHAIAELNAITVSTLVRDTVIAAHRLTEIQNKLGKSNEYI